jgi:hypothetical protein
MLLGFAASSRTLRHALLFIYKLVIHHTMKTITFYLIIFINCICWSQDTRLFEQTWILHDLIIDGESNIPPINSEQNFIPADFVEPNDFYTGVCDGTGGAGQIEYNGITDFNLTKGMYWLAGSCDLNENNLYAALYANAFWNQSIGEPYQYEIIDNGQDRMLTVTAINGNQAIYSNNFLSITEFKNTHLVIYPVPVNDIISLKYREDITVNRIKIYDLQGKQVLLITKNLSQINVQNLKTGIYFISIENDENEILTKKFIKR